MSEFRFDEIGYWSELKLEIVREYAKAYCTVLGKQTVIRKFLYIDAFAGAGVHISRRSGEFVPGSPLNALEIEPRFSEYHFIDLDHGKIEHLRNLTGNEHNVHIYNEDCNEVLLKKVFPRARWDDYNRALCLLDPYGLNLDWNVVSAAGQMRSVEIFINFMVMDANRNVLWKNPDAVPPEEIARMNAFWGDNSWREILYEKSQSLFPDFELESKATNADIAAAYQDRLKTVAGFSYVPDPIPMRNKRGAIIYYLFFASANEKGAKIATHLFKKYRNLGAV